MHIRVECYAGYRGEETPRKFWLGSRKIEVSEIQDRWIAPDHRYFKLAGDDDSVYIIRHDMESLDWELIFYRKSGTPLDAGDLAEGLSDI
ncbi:MAG: hypothetical protein AB1427_11870 [Thermodesulfobacteriota bacterium]